MRNLFIAFISIGIFASASAIACPNLEGSYTCQDQNGETSTAVVRQENRAGVMVYFIDADGELQELITDGQRHPMDANRAEFQNATYSAACQNNVLNTNIDGDIVNEGTVIAHINIDTAASLQGNVLEMVSSGIISGEWGSQPIENQVTTCSRN